MRCTLKEKVRTSLKRHQMTLYEAGTLLMDRRMDMVTAYYNLSIEKGFADLGRRGGRKKNLTNHQKARIKFTWR